MTEKSDAELVGLARTGDKHAFGILIERYQGMAIRVALRMVAHEDLAQELTQEALLQAYLSLNHLKNDAHFKNWLYGIVLNVCRSYLRDQKITFFSLEALTGGLQFDTILFSGPSPSPEEIVEAHELHQIVLNAVNALAPKDRTATLLFYFDQLSLQEIATILGISTGAVKARLFRARKQLREQLYSEVTERIPREQRRKAMVKVSIADVVKQERKDEQQGTSRPLYVVVLHDEAGRRALPIWVGPFEGWALAMGLGNFPMPRPMTYTFITSLLKAAAVQVEEVRIESLEADTFYAVVKIRSGETVREVDARPSDAMALALHMASPIYAAEEVLQKGGVTISTEPGKSPQLRKGVDALLREAEASRRAVQAQPSPQPTKEEIEKARAELIASVFGGGT